MTAWAHDDGSSGSRATARAQFLAIFGRFALFALVVTGGFR
jgi:hypothetical protein